MLWSAFFCDSLNIQHYDRKWLYIVSMLNGVYNSINIVIQPLPYSIHYLMLLAFVDLSIPSMHKMTLNSIVHQIVSCFNNYGRIVLVAVLMHCLLKFNNVCGT